MHRIDTWCLTRTFGDGWWGDRIIITCSSSSWWMVMIDIRSSGSSSSSSRRGCTGWLRRCSGLLWWRRCRCWFGCSWLWRHGGTVSVSKKCETLHKKKKSNMKRRLTQCNKTSEMNLIDVKKYHQKNVDQDSRNNVDSTWKRKKEERKWEREQGEKGKEM